MSEEEDALQSGLESLGPKEKFWNRMFVRLPAEIQSMVWHHAAEDAGPQMLYLDVELLRSMRGRHEQMPDPSCPHGPNDYIHLGKLSAKLFNRKRLSDATRPVRSLGRVCREARKRVCRAYPDALGLRFRTTNTRGTRSILCHGSADGPKTIATGDYYTLRINGQRDICVLALSDWGRQTYALRKPKTLLSSLVPKCIRHLGIDLDTLYNTRMERVARWRWRGRAPCGCSLNIPGTEERFPPPHPDPHIPDDCGIMCRWEPLVPFLKSIETVVLVGVSNPTLALPDPMPADGVPPRDK